MGLDKYRAGVAWRRRCGARWRPDQDRDSRPRAVRADRRAARCPYRWVAVAVAAALDHWHGRAGGPGTGGWRFTASGIHPPFTAYPPRLHTPKLRWKT